jgi:hypothetical protein
MKPDAAHHAMAEIGRAHHERWTSRAVEGGLFTIRSGMAGGRELTRFSAEFNLAIHVAHGLPRLLQAFHPMKTDHRRGDQTLERPEF